MSNINQQKAIQQKIDYYNKVSDSIESLENTLDQYEFLNEMLPPIRGIYENFIRDLKYIASLESTTEHDYIAEISGSQLKGKILKRHPCCDNPKPKSHTESKRNGKIGGYSIHTKCESCGMRY